MAKMQNVPQQRQRPIIIMQHPKQKRRFRWQIVLLPLLFLITFKLFQKLDLSQNWLTFCDSIGIANKPRFTSLALTGLALIGIVLAIRILKNTSRRN